MRISKFSYNFHKFASRTMYRAKFLVWNKILYISS